MFALPAESAKVLEELQIEYRLESLPMVKDRKGNPITGPRIRVTVNDMITKQKILEHIGPEGTISKDGEREVAVAAIELAKGTERPLTPAQMHTELQRLKAENEKLKEPRTGPKQSGPLTIKQQCDQLRVRLAQEGIEIPSGQSSRLWLKNAKALLANPVEETDDGPSTEDNPTAFPALVDN